VTHDRYLLDRVTTGILRFEGDGKVTRYAGAYQAYSEARTSEEEARSKAREARPKPAPVKTVAKPAGLSKNEQRELDGILDKIEEAERAASAIEAELGEASLYAAGADPARAAAVRARLEEARAAAAQLTARWEELEAKKAAS